MVHVKYGRLSGARAFHTTLPSWQRHCLPSVPNSAANSALPMLESEEGLRRLWGCWSASWREWHPDINAKQASEACCPEGVGSKEEACVETLARQRKTSWHSPRRATLWLSPLTHGRQFATKRVGPPLPPRQYLFRAGNHGGASIVFLRCNLGSRKLPTLKSDIVGTCCPPSHKYPTKMAT